MLIELGPVASEQVLSWTRFSRRLMMEIKTKGDTPMSAHDTADWIRAWTALIDQWAKAAANTDVFRWSEVIDCEKAAFVVHGMEKCICSGDIWACITEGDRHQQTPFTLHVMHAFLSALEAEGAPYLHHAEQVKAAIAEQAFAR